jgi:hypothetical protein
MCIRDFAAFHKHRAERGAWYRDLREEDREFADELIEHVMTLRCELAYENMRRRGMLPEGIRGYGGPCRCEKPSISVSTAFSSDHVCYKCFGWDKFEWVHWSKI